MKRIGKKYWYFCLNLWDELSPFFSCWWQSIDPKLYGIGVWYKVRSWAINPALTLFRCGSWYWLVRWSPGAKLFYEWIKFCSLKNATSTFILVVTIVVWSIPRVGGSPKVTLGKKWKTAKELINWEKLTDININYRIPDIGLGVRVFANGPGDLGSIPGRVIPKTQKMVLDASLLNTQH